MDTSPLTGTLYGYICIRTEPDSDDESKDEIIGEKISAWATIHDREISSIFEDYKDRSAMQKLKEVLKPNDTVIFYSIPDSFGTVADFFDFLEAVGYREIRIVFIKEGLDTGTSYGRYVSVMFNELSRLWTSEESNMVRITPKQNEQLKEILTKEQMEKLSPYIDVLSSLIESESDE